METTYSFLGHEHHKDRARRIKEEITCEIKLAKEFCNHPENKNIQLYFEKVADLSNPFLNLEYVYIYRCYNSENGFNFDVLTLEVLENARKHFYISQAEKPNISLHKSIDQLVHSQLVLYMLENIEDFLKNK